MPQKHLPPEIKKAKIGMTIDPKVLAQLDVYRCEYSRSAVIEGIIAGYLELAAEEGITKFEPTIEKQ